MEKPKRTKKPFGVMPLQLAGILFCLVLLLTCLLAGIFARYAKIGKTNNPARVIQFEKLTINENDDVFTDTESHTMLFAPGITLHRNTSVSFGGSEAACFVFLRVNTSDFTKIDDYAYSYGTVTDKTIDFSVDIGWTFLKTDDGASIYYTITDPNEALDAKPVLQNGNITVGESFTRTEMQAIPSTLHIAFDAYAVQLDGFGDFATETEHAEAAWDSVKQHDIYI